MYILKKALKELVALKLRGSMLWAPIAI